MGIKTVQQKIYNVSLLEWQVSSKFMLVPNSVKNAKATQNMILLHLLFDSKETKLTN